MRYDKGHKQETRSKILEAAAKDFRSGGIPGVGIAAIMGDAGLTNGAFYAHFESKEALVREAVALSMSAQLEAFQGTPDLADIVGAYLSPENRDQLEQSCISAATVADLGRQSEVTRQTYTDGLLDVMSAVAEHLEGGDAGERLRRAIVVFGSMIGCLQLARAVSDPELSDQILETGVEAALRLASMNR